ncbi:Calcineurin-like phosphoesterase [Seminavis robusta]|uniref:Calcineurin-like phosphoesterase n=1 Tax=Seminavis robusta TaxID=568900 RepID=A0A9N8HB94_9STRA|nr:Calcineurin-like phosphoesterase [Seminavis robusta]|eukprot:Sro253_g099730.1 Calcineurin-like phosphoesterase (184) ;mRNA; f:46-597
MTTTTTSGDGSESDTKAQVRLDATIDLKTGRLVKVPSSSSVTTTSDESYPEWFLAYVPQEEDGCYLEDLDGSIGDMSSDKVCWWHMADGKVLGLHRGQLVEYDAKTLAPLGIVVPEENLRNREVLVVQNKTTLVLVDDKTQEMEVVHPNTDGSYWRRVSRSKVVRLEELAREEVAKRWMEQMQ